MFPFLILFNLLSLDLFVFPNVVRIFRLYCRLMSDTVYSPHTTASLCVGWWMELIVFLSLWMRPNYFSSEMPPIIFNCLVLWDAGWFHLTYSLPWHIMQSIMWLKTFPFILILVSIVVSMVLFWLLLLQLRFIQNIPWFKSKNKASIENS